MLNNNLILFALMGALFIEVFIGTSVYLVLTIIPFISSSLTSYPYVISIQEHYKKVIGQRKKKILLEQDFFSVFFLQIYICELKCIIGKINKFFLTLKEKIFFVFV